MGLITEAVRDEDLDETVAAMARRLQNGAPHAIKWTKASINAGLKAVANAVMDRAAGFEAVSELMQDHRVALDALAAKQPPKFLGA